MSPPRSAAAASEFLQRRHRGAVLEEVNAGRWLRQQREQLTGKWQGPLGVPRGSIVICMGLGSPADDLATELLVRLLRSERIDARHFSHVRNGWRPAAWRGPRRRRHRFSGERVPQSGTRARRLD